VLRARRRASRCFDILRSANECQFSSLLLSKKTQRKARNKLTSEMKIDNLEKFAKTSLVAEVILDRLSQDLESQRQGRKEVDREI
jgi:hypothetical protein